MKTIALIAHDNKKQEIVDWALSNIETLQGKAYSKDWLLKIGFYGKDVLRVLR